MTVTDPAGPPDLLTRRLQLDHDRLDHLLTELSRDPPTPGVLGQLRATFLAELMSHLAAEGEVLGAADWGDDHGLRAQLAEDADRLRQVAHGGVDADRVSELVDVLERHRRTVEDALARLRARAGAEELARLGYGYAQALEAFLHNLR